MHYIFFIKKTSSSTKSQKGTNQNAVGSNHKKIFLSKSSESLLIIHTYMCLLLQKKVKRQTYFLIRKVQEKIL